MRNRAFTLIELLVVIAIIAILAAILFPVFAQAKMAAKASVALSNTKQTGTAAVIYTADYDDTFPLAGVLRPAGGELGMGLLYPVPYNTGTNLGGNTVWEGAARQNMAACFVTNSIQPYSKSYDLQSFTSNINYSQPTTTRSFDAAFAAPATVTLTFNGDLHKMSTTAVNSPSVVPMFWAGNGATNYKGFASVSPSLNCGGTVDDCTFNAGSVPGSLAWKSGGGSRLDTQPGDLGFLPTNPTTSWAVFSNKKAPFVRTDTSAKMLPQASATYPTILDKSSAFIEPFAYVYNGYDISGTKYNVYANYVCTDGQTVYTASGYDRTQYSCYFRPDRVK